MEKSKVYFTKTITPEKVLEMYKVLGIELPGKVAVKLHTGEKVAQKAMSETVIHYINICGSGVEDEC